MADDLEPPARAAAAAAGRARELTDGMDLSGKLYRGEHEGEVRGWLYEHRSKLRIEFRGGRDPRPQKGGYLIMGRVVKL